MPQNDNDSTTQPITFSLFTSTDNSNLTKEFGLDENGKITKTSHAKFSRGVAKIQTLQGGLAELPERLDDLESVQCIATGTFGAERCRIIPQGASDDGSSRYPVKHRTKDAMSQPNPGLLLFDHDPSPRMPVAIQSAQPSDLMRALARAVPTLEGIGWVGRGSSSAGISNAATGETYSGGGLHVYIGAHISNLEAFRCYLEARLWLADTGYIELAANGVRLLRTPVDLSVLSPERLIFEAAPICGPDVKREPPAWQTHQGDVLCIKDLSLAENERAEVAERQEAAKNEKDVLEEAESRYEHYRDQQATRTARLQGLSKESVLKKIPRYDAGRIEKSTIALPALHAIEIDGQWMTAKQLSAKAVELNGRSMPDPVEGAGYGASTAKLYANQDCPIIHSLAHGVSTSYLLPKVSITAGSDAHEVETTTATVQEPPSSQDTVGANLTLPLKVESFPHIKGNGDSIRPLSTVENYAHLIDSYDVTLEYDVIKKTVQVAVPGLTGTVDNQLASAITRIESLATLNGLSTRSSGRYLNLLADQRQVNPIANWITRKPWDGENRLPALYDTLTEREGYPTALKKTLIYRWILSAVAAALMPSGFQSRGVLTLQGAQGIGKTSWFLKLVADAFLRENYVLTGHHLDPAIKDTIILAIQHWIVELGELDSSFKKDIARIKGVITNTADKVRVPYAPVASEYQRRTVFCASVNEEHFLVDPTGNSRWWVIPVTAIDYQHDIDMQQVFAQLKQDFDNDEQWWLTQDEEALLHKQNHWHSAVNVIEEALLEAIDDSLPDDQHQAMTASQVLQHLGYARPSNAQARECGTVLRTHFGAPRKIQGIQKWRLPLPTLL